MGTSSNDIQTDFQDITQIPEMVTAKLAPRVREYPPGYSVVIHPGIHKGLSDLFRNL